MPSSTHQRERLLRRSTFTTTATVGGPSIHIPPVPSVNHNRSTPTSHSVPRVNLKTSITHPINVSWIVPEELITGLSKEPLPQSLDLLDVYSSTSLYEHYCAARVEERSTASTNSSSDASANESSTTVALLGNLALSSCPGKKVRLSGPVRGRATIDRDLELDFQRLKTIGISAVVCCLNNQELEFLGAPWPQYNALAQQCGLEILRIPMIEGGCPESLEQIDNIVTQVNQFIENGQKVLAHCRGGVGRAGLVACCWLLKRQLCFTADCSIQFVRLRRSPKAIETMKQVDFIVQYGNYVQWKQQQPQHTTRELVNTTATTTTTVLPISTIARS